MALSVRGTKADKSDPETGVCTSGGILGRLVARPEFADLPHRTAIALVKALGRDWK